MTQEEWETKQGGLCCFSGEDYHDTCGTCYPTAIVAWLPLSGMCIFEASYKNVCSKGRDKCMTCGGSWCQSLCF